jgi:hypothetical protein
LSPISRLRRLQNFDTPQSEGNARPLLHTAYEMQERAVMRRPWEKREMHLAILIQKLEGVASQFKSRNGHPQDHEVVSVSFAELDAILKGVYLLAAVKEAMRQ